MRRWCDEQQHVNGRRVAAVNDDKVGGDAYILPSIYLNVAR
jgi:hypothetical protein